MYIENIDSEDSYKTPGDFSDPRDIAAAYITACKAATPRLGNSHPQPKIRLILIYVGL